MTLHQLKVFTVIPTSPDPPATFPVPSSIYTTIPFPSFKWTLLFLVVGVVVVTAVGHQVHLSVTMALPDVSTINDYLIPAFSQMSRKFSTMSYP